MDAPQPLVIEKDVDARSGKIEHFGDVLIKGSVRSGLSVNAQGSITVELNVEDAVLEAGSNIVVLKEFSGTGKGVITAKGNVEIGTINKQAVRCDGDVTIKEKAIDCTIASKGAVKILGTGDDALCGANISAAKELSVTNAGYSKQEKTILQAGDKTPFDQLAASQIKLRTITSQKNIVENQLNGITKLRMINKAKYESQIDTMEDLMEKGMLLDQQITDITNSINSYKALCLNASKARIIVRGEVQPGVTLCINDATTTLNHKLSKCLFMYNQGKVIVKGLT
jgi:uncharacterized protein